MKEDLVDRIYEAAFVPELWPDVLDRLGKLSDSVGGVLLVADERHPPRWTASSPLESALNGYMSAEAWKSNERPSRSLAIGQRGFRRDIDVFSQQDLNADTTRAELMKHGLGWETGAVMAMPHGEVVTFSMDRRLEDGPHDPDILPALNDLWPHLARAGLMATRLGLERALSAVATMEAMNLPAAVLSEGGRVLAANALLDRLPSVFVPRAHGKLSLGSSAADALLQAAILDLSGEGPTAIRSFPAPGGEGRPALVVHVLPLRRAAHDIFSGGDLLVVATAVSAGALVPSADLLNGLFDLSSAEAKLAAALVAGVSLKEAAAGQGIKLSTARSYLEQIFRKTGTHRQGQLISLLKGAQHISTRFV